MLGIPPLPPFPTRDQVEAYVASITNELPTMDSVQALPSDIANLVQGLYDDLMRFGPPALPKLPELHMPEIMQGGVGRLFVVEVPAALPPPPPKTTYEKLLDWIGEHKLATGLISSVTIGGLVYLALYSGAFGTRRRRRVAVNNGVDREIVVILGADSVPYGSAVVRDFQKNGYIVIASVSSGEAGEEMEKNGDGYVRALVLDAEEPGSIPHFLRSLSSSMSLKFPTTVHGDPYAVMSSSSQSVSLARVASVISLLSLGPSELMSFSELDSPIILAETYTHQLMTQALTPLSILHSTLPLFKPSLTLGSPGSSRFSRTGGSIILCVPAVARVGVLGSSSTSMAAASVMHGFDVLRRESKLAADKGSGNAIEGANVRFITVDVGEISGGDIDGGEGTRTVRWERRKPSDVSAFSQRLMDIVDGSRRPWSAAWIWQLVLGSHRSIGAGAWQHVSQPPSSTFFSCSPRRLERLQASLQAARDDGLQLSASAVSPNASATRPAAAAFPSASPLSPTLTQGSTARTKPQASVVDINDQRRRPTEAELAAISTTASAAASLGGPSAGPASEVSSEADISSEAESEDRSRTGRGRGEGSVADSWVSVQEDD